MSNFDDDELYDDFNDDFGMDDFGDEDLDDLMGGGPPIDERNPIKSRVDAGMINFKEQFNIEDDPTIIENLIKQTLPKEISRVTTGLTDIVDNTEDAIEENKTVFKESINTIATAAGHIAPKTGFLANIIDKVKSLTHRVSDYDYVQSEEEREKADIGRKLDDLMGSLDGKDEVAIEQNRVRESNIQSRLSANTVKLLAEQVSYSIQGSNFNNNVTASFYRRSLELQYEHLFVSRKILKATLGSGQTQSKMLTDIVHNTNLPDIVKVRTIEAAKAAGIQRLAGDFTSSLFKNTDGNDSWSARASKRIKRIIGRGTEKIAEVAGATSVIDGDSSKSLQAHVLASDGLADKFKELGTSKLRDIASKTEVGRKMILEADRMDMDFAHYLESKKTGKNEFFDSVLQAGSNILSEGGYEADFRVGQEAQDLTVGMTKLFHDTVTTAIPTLLGDIRQSVKAIETGDSQEAMFYDTQTGKYVRRDGLGVEFENKIGKSIDTKSFSSRTFLKDTIGEELSEEDYAEFMRAVSKRIFSGQPFAIHSLDKTGFYDGMDKQVAKRIKLGIKEATSNKLGFASGQKERDTTTAFKTIKDAIPDPTNLVRKAISDGTINDLVEAGIVNYDVETNEFIVNREKYLEFISGHLSLDDLYTASKRNRSRFDGANGNETISSSAQRANKHFDDLVNRKVIKERATLHVKTILNQWRNLRVEIKSLIRDVGKDGLTTHRRKVMSVLKEQASDIKEILKDSPDYEKEHRKMSSELEALLELYRTTIRKSNIDLDGDEEVIVDERLKEDGELTELRKKIEEAKEESVREDITTEEFEKNKIELELLNKKFDHREALVLDKSFDELETEEDFEKYVRESQEERSKERSIIKRFASFVGLTENDYSLTSRALGKLGFDDAVSNNSLNRAIDDRKEFGDESGFKEDDSQNWYTSLNYRRDITQATQDEVNLEDAILRNKISNTSDSAEVLKELNKNNNIEELEEDVSASDGVKRVIEKDLSLTIDKIGSSSSLRRKDRKKHEEKLEKRKLELEAIFSTLISVKTQLEYHNNNIDTILANTDYSPDHKFKMAMKSYSSARLAMEIIINYKDYDSVRNYPEYSKLIDSEGFISFATLHDFYDKNLRPKKKLIQQIFTAELKEEQRIRKVRYSNEVRDRRIGEELRNPAHPEFIGPRQEDEEIGAIHSTLFQTRGQSTTFSENDTDYDSTQLTDRLGTYSSPDFIGPLEERSGTTNEEQEDNIDAAMERRRAEELHRPVIEDEDEEVIESSGGLDGFDAFGLPETSSSEVNTLRDLLQNISDTIKETHTDLINFLDSKCCNADIVDDRLSSVYHEPEYTEEEQRYFDSILDAQRNIDREEEDRENEDREEDERVSNSFDGPGYTEEEEREYEEILRRIEEAELDTEQDDRLSSVFHEPEYTEEEQRYFDEVLRRIRENRPDVDADSTEQDDRLSSVFHEPEYTEEEQRYFDEILRRIREGESDVDNTEQDDRLSSVFHEPEYTEEEQRYFDEMISRAIDERLGEEREVVIRPIPDDGPEDIDRGSEDGNRNRNSLDEQDNRSDELRYGGASSSGGVEDDSTEITQTRPIGFRIDSDDTKSVDEVTKDETKSTTNPFDLNDIDVSKRETTPFDLNNIEVVEAGRHKEVVTPLEELVELIRPMSNQAVDEIEDKKKEERENREGGWRWQLQQEKDDLELDRLRNPIEVNVINEKEEEEKSSIFSKIGSILKSPIVKLAAAAYAIKKTAEYMWNNSSKVMEKVSTMWEESSAMTKAIVGGVGAVGLGALLFKVGKTVTSLVRATKNVLTAVRGLGGKSRSNLSDTDIDDFDRDDKEDERRNRKGRKGRKGRGFSSKSPTVERRGTTGKSPTVERRGTVGKSFSTESRGTTGKFPSMESSRGIGKAPTMGSRSVFDKTKGMVGKLASEATPKSVSKMGIKKIPGLSMYFKGREVVDELGKGNYKNAALAGASGLANTFGGPWGVAGSFALDGMLEYNRMYSGEENFNELLNRINKTTTMIANDIAERNFEYNIAELEGFRVEMAKRYELLIEPSEDTTNNYKKSLSFVDRTILDIRTATRNIIEIGIDAIDNGSSKLWKLVDEGIGKLDVTSSDAVSLMLKSVKDAYKTLRDPTNFETELYNTTDSKLRNMLINLRLASSNVDSEKFIETLRNKTGDIFGFSNKSKEKPEEENCMANGIKGYPGEHGDPRMYGPKRKENKWNPRRYVDPPMYGPKREDSLAPGNRWNPKEYVDPPKGGGKWNPREYVDPVMYGPENKPEDKSSGWFGLFDTGGWFGPEAKPKEQYGPNRGIDVSKDVDARDAGITVGKDVGISVGKDVGIEVGEEAVLKARRKAYARDARNDGITVGKDVGIDVGISVGKEALFRNGTKAIEDKNDPYAVRGTVNEYEKFVPSEHPLKTEDNDSGIDSKTGKWNPRKFVVDEIAPVREKKIKRVQASPTSSGIKGGDTSTLLNGISDGNPEGVTHAQKLEQIRMNLPWLYSQFGKPYVWGGTVNVASMGYGFHGYDCSSLTASFYGRMGIWLNRWKSGTRERTAREQFDSSEFEHFMDIKEAKPGDIVWFKDGKDWKSADHVGIYVGDGYLVHSKGKVGPTLTKVWVGNYKAIFVGFGRYKGGKTLSSEADFLKKNTKPKNISDIDGSQPTPLTDADQFINSRHTPSESGELIATNEYDLDTSNLKAKEDKGAGGIRGPEDILRMLSRIKTQSMSSAETVSDAIGQSTMDVFKETGEVLSDKDNKINTAFSASLGISKDGSLEEIVPRTNKLIENALVDSGVSARDYIADLYDKYSITDKTRITKNENGDMYDANGILIMTREDLGKDVNFADIKTVGDIWQWVKHRNEDMTETELYKKFIYDENKHFGSDVLSGVNMLVQVSKDVRDGTLKSAFDAKKKAQDLARTVLGEDEREEAALKEEAERKAKAAKHFDDIGEVTHRKNFKNGIFLGDRDDLLYGDKEEEIDLKEVINDEPYGPKEFVDPYRPQTLNESVTEMINRENLKKYNFEQAERDRIGNEHGDYEKVAPPKIIVNNPVDPYTKGMLAELKKLNENFEKFGNDSTTTVSSSQENISLKTYDPRTVEANKTGQKVDLRRNLYYK